MISVLIVCDRLNNSVSLINHKALQPVFLVKVSIEILLHRLSTLLILIDAFLIVLSFLQVNVFDQITNLLESICALGLS